jgi:hypothetical protein
LSNEPNLSAYEPLPLGSEKLLNDIRVHNRDDRSVSLRTKEGLKLTFVGFYVFSATVSQTVLAALVAWLFAT